MTHFFAKLRACWLCRTFCAFGSVCAARFICIATQQAAVLLRRAHQIQPNSEIGAHLGEVLWMQGQQEEARQIWRAAQKIDASNKTLQKTLQRFLPER